MHEAIQEAKRHSWTPAVVIWAILICLAWSGCGPGRTMPIANGYECHIDKAFISISHPDEFGDSLGDAGEIDLVGDVVFGTRVEWDSNEIVGYFVLDTKTGKLDTYQSHAEWNEELGRLGLTADNIRWPGPFFHGVGWRIKLTGWLCLGCMVLGISLWIRALFRPRRDTLGLL